MVFNTETEITAEEKTEKPTFNENHKIEFNKSNINKIMNQVENKLPYKINYDVSTEAKKVIHCNTVRYYHLTFKPEGYLRLTGKDKKENYKEYTNIKNYDEAAHLIITEYHNQEY